MALLTRFDTPASLRDLPAGSVFYDNWHNYLSTSIAASTPGGGGVSGGKVGEFYNPTLVDVNVDGERALVWMAFPRAVLMPNRDDLPAAFAVAEDRDAQNEYCEWRVVRNGAGKITKIEIVTESPEYWEALWSVDRNRVVELYRELVGDPAVQESDLHDGSGKYQRRNCWNDDDAGGIVHLIQGINTLDDALGLAQAIGDANAVQDNYEAGGAGLTSVDPRVILDTDSLVRKGFSITLRDPIGLYIAGWDDTGWTKPDGKPVGDYWTIVRGRPGQVLRLKYEVPATDGFVVGDIRIGGRPIDWGGQIAEHVTVTIVGTAGSRAKPAPTPATTEGHHEEASPAAASSSQSKTETRSLRARGARTRGVGGPGEPA
jgi:hypothetical protein